MKCEGKKKKKTGTSSSYLGTPSDVRVHIQRSRFMIFQVFLLFGCVTYPFVPVEDLQSRKAHGLPKKDLFTNRTENAAPDLPETPHPDLLPRLLYVTACRVSTVPAKGRCGDRTRRFSEFRRHVAETLCVSARKQKPSV